jgi:hypothetical protein
MPSRIDNLRNYLLAQWIQINLALTLACPCWPKRNNNLETRKTNEQD